MSLLWYVTRLLDVLSGGRVIIFARPVPVLAMPHCRHD
jgi:hypothetical protein